MNKLILGIGGYVCAISYMVGTWGLLYQEHPELWGKNSGLIIAPIVCGILMGIAGALILLCNEEF